MSDNRHKRDTVLERRGNKLFFDNNEHGLLDLPEEDSEIEIPSHFEVCDVCNGTGSHVNPSIDENGLTAEDFAEDPDFREEYMSGAYDVTCYACGGQRVTLEPDDDATGRIREILEYDYEYRRDMAQERRYRSMGIEY